ncbi:hypothetical protein Acsp04_12720 [Actinomadura sp. NBRC 104425]|nr:hypothetical protein Acsp04_12720 [Actinomadura sp. NBRC 104425]
MIVVPKACSTTRAATHGRNADTSSTAAATSTPTFHIVPAQNGVRGAGGSMDGTRGWAGGTSGCPSRE